MATGQRVIQVPRGWTACVAIGAAVFLVALGLTASMSAEPAPSQAAPASAFPAPADVDFFRKNIEPIFMRDRGGTMPGYAACVMCHTWQTSLRFRLETPATDAGWTAEQSRRNFEFAHEGREYRVSGEQPAAGEAARCRRRAAWAIRAERSGSPVRIPSTRWC